MADIKKAAEAFAKENIAKRGEIPRGFFYEMKKSVGAFAHQIGSASPPSFQNGAVEMFSIVSPMMPMRISTGPVIRWKKKRIIRLRVPVTFFIGRFSPVHLE